MSEQDLLAAAVEHLEQVPLRMARAVDRLGGERVLREWMRLAAQRQLRQQQRQA